MSPSSVRFELVPPCHRLQFHLPGSAETVVIDEAGYETDDSRVIAELDEHPEHVTRTVKKAKR